jgi:chemotaxis protein CheD
VTPQIVKTGEVEAARFPNRLWALDVGACVVIALYDPAARVGGLAHVPWPSQEDPTEPPGWAIGSALRLLLARVRQLGASRSRVRAKAAGAATLLAGSEPSPAAAIARQNVEALDLALADLGIPLDARELGGHKARSIELDLADGTLRVRCLGRDGQSL